MRIPSYEKVLEDSTYTAKFEKARIYVPSAETEVKTRNDTEAYAAKQEPDPCSICMDIPTNSITLEKCKHTFCKECIEQYFKKIQPNCPSCGIMYEKLPGNQPRNGTMRITRSKSGLSGYEGYGTITIHYTINAGIQEVRVR